MFRNVLLTTDGSALSRAALPHALRLVDRQDGVIRVLEVVEPPEVAPGQAVPLERGAKAAAVTRDADAAMHAAARAQVEAMGQAIAGASRDRVNVAVLDGMPGETIVADARRSHADVVVMATHGRSGLARTLLGSVADSVVRALHDVPLVLVRPAPEDEALFAGDQWIAASADRLRAAREPLHDALVPIDGSALSASVLPHVARAVAPGTAVTLLMVIAALPGDADVAPAAEHHGARPPEEPANFADREARAWIERGRARLDDARERLEAAGVRNVDARLRGGTPQDVIVEFARRQRADLVAMATHGRSGLARTLLGSVPDHVLRHLAGTPILLVRPAAEPAPEA